MIEASEDQVKKLVRACSALVKNSESISRKRSSVRDADLDALQKAYDDLPVSFLLDCEHDEE